MRPEAGLQVTVAPDPLLRGEAVALEAAVVIDAVQVNQAQVGSRFSFPSVRPCRPTSHDNGAVVTRGLS